MTDDRGQDLQPSWSRDGEWIYFSSDRSGEQAIWKIPASGGDAVQVTAKGHEGYAFESAGGQTLYLVGDGLWSVPTQGGEPELLVDQQVANDSVSIARDGIYMNTTGRFRLEFFDFQAKTVRPVFEYSYLAYAGLSVSPDGQTILFVQGGPPESDIMLLDEVR